MSNKSKKQKDVKADNSGNYRNNMAVNCNKCLDKIQDTSSSIRCFHCGKYYHLLCCGERSRNRIKNLQETKWFCSKKCERLNESSWNKSYVDDNSSSDEYDSAELSSKSTTKILEKLDFLMQSQNKIDVVIQSQDFLSNKFDTLSALTNDIVTENKQLKMMLQSTINENKQLNNRVIYLEKEVNILKQQQIHNNLVITGIPKTENENLIDIVKTIGNVLKVPVVPADIITAKRMVIKNQKHIPPITVQFNNYAIKNNLMAAKREAGPLTTQQINIQTVEDKPLFLSHQLIAYNRKLQYELRQLANRCGYQYVWFVHDRFYLKKNNNSKDVYCFQTLEELENFKEISNTNQTRANITQPSSSSQNIHK